MLLYAQYSYNSNVIIDYCAVYYNVKTNVTSTVFFSCDGSKNDLINSVIIASHKTHLRCTDVN